MIKPRGFVKTFTILTAFSLVAQLLFVTVFQKAYAVEEPGISKSEIRLGSSYPMSGRASSYHNDFFAGANAYFEYLNSSGGIFGRKIVVVYKDDKGIPQEAVVQNNRLILQDKVFALFNSAPITSTHLAIYQSVALRQRGVPDLAVTSPYSEFFNAKKFPTSFVFAPNARQEAKVLLSYIKNNFSGIPINLVYENNDLGSELISIWQSSGVIFDVVQPYISGTTPSGQAWFRTDIAGVMNFGYHYSIGGYEKKINVASNNYPLFLRGSSIGDNTINPSLNNIYTNHFLPLSTDGDDPFIVFFSELFSKYVPNKPVTQQMIEGANAAYVVSQALASIGSQPTRERLIEFMKKNSASLSSASFSPLDFSTGGSRGGFTQYIAKYDGNKWSRVSDLYFIDSKGLSLSSIENKRLPLLPKGLPVMKDSAVSNRSAITCIKGKNIKKVTAVKPKCPTGFSIKK